MRAPADTVVRAITQDGAYRVISLATAETVGSAIAAQSARGQNASVFADLLTGTILVRETMAPRLRVQGIVKGEGRVGTIVADSHPDGTSRGLVQLPEPSTALRLGPGSVLQMMRTMPSGGVAQGLVDVGAAGSLRDALMVYMVESEQVAAVLNVGHVLGDDGRVQLAGGYIVQLLPEAPRPVQMIMTERLAAFPSMSELLVDPKFSPRWLLDELLYGMPYDLLEESALRFACGCSLERVLSALSTLPKGDLVDLVTSNEAIETRCDYCLKEYSIPPEQLRALLEES